MAGPTRTPQVADPTKSPVAVARGIRAKKCTVYGRESSEAAEALRDLEAAKLEAYVEKVLAAAPPLTPEQRTKLADLLRP